MSSLTSPEPYRFLLNQIIEGHRNKRFSSSPQRRWRCFDFRSPSSTLHNFQFIYLFGCIVKENGRGKERKRCPPEQTKENFLKNRKFLRKNWVEASRREGKTRNKQVLGSKIPIHLVKSSCFIASFSFCCSKQDARSTITKKFRISHVITLLISNVSPSTCCMMRSFSCDSWIVYSALLTIWQLSSLHYY